MSEKMLQNWANAMTLHGRKFQVNTAEGTITVWPEFAEEGGPVTLSTVVEVAQWTKAHPMSNSPVRSMLSGTAASRRYR